MLDQKPDPTDQLMEDDQALSSPNGKFIREIGGSNVNVQSKEVAMSPASLTKEQEDDDYTAALRGTTSPEEDLHNGTSRDSRDARKVKSRRRTDLSPRSRTRGEHRTRARSMTRSSPHGTEAEVNRRSVSRTPRKSRSNSVEDLSGGKGDTKAPSTTMRRARSRSRSRVRDGDRVSRVNDAKSTPGTDVADVNEITPDASSTRDCGRHRSRSKSVTRDAMRSRSCARGITGRKTLQGSREQTIDTSLIQGKRNDQKSQQRERSKSRARRSNRKALKGVDPESDTSRTLQPEPDSKPAGKCSMDPETSDGVGAHSPPNESEQFPPKTKVSENRTPDVSDTSIERGLREIDSASNMPPDPSGVLYCNASIYFSKDDLPAIDPDDEINTEKNDDAGEEDLSKSRHSEHRRRSRANGLSGTKAVSDRKGTRGSLSNKKNFAQREPSPSPQSARTSATSGTPKRKQRSVQLLTTLPSRRERRKSLSTTQPGDPPLGPESKFSHGRDGEVMTFQQNQPSHRKNESEGKHDPKKSRTRPNKCSGTPTKSLSCPLQKNKQKSSRQADHNASFDENMISEKELKDTTIKGTGEIGGSVDLGNGEKLNLGIRDVGGTDDVPNSTVDDAPVHRPPQSHGENDLPKFTGHQNPCLSLVDYDTSYAESFASAKASVPGIFGHLNRSTATIATHELATTLGPYLPEDHPLAMFLKSNEFESVLENTHLSQTEHSASSPGLLDALLDSNPRTSSVAAPSLCPSSMNANRTLDSLLDAGSKFSSLADPSICVPLKHTTTKLCSSSDNKKTTAKATSPDQTSSSQIERRSAGNMEDVLPSNFPSSLDGLLGAQPRSLKSSLPEPSICVSPKGRQMKPTVQSSIGAGGIKSSVILDDGCLAPSKPRSQRLNSQAAAGPKPDAGDLFQKDKDFFISSGGNTFDASHQLPSEPTRGFGNFDDTKTSEAMPQASRHSTNDLGELLPSSEHVKIHRASGGGGSSSDFQSNPGYLQLDLETLGSEDSPEAPKTKERLSTSRHISLRKSLANFRKRPGRESLLEDCD